MKMLEKGAPVARNWRAINELAGEVTALERATSARSAGRFARTPHPFMLYTLPKSLRASPDADDWRRFRVRHGLVLGSEAAGTDLYDWPDADGFALADMTDILVPTATAAYWFWLENDGGTWTVDHGASVPDGAVPIGFVDTDTMETEKIALVRQVLRTDIVSLPSGGTRWAEVDGIGDLASDYVSVDLDGASVDVALPWLLRAAQSPSEDHFRMPEYAVGDWLLIAQPQDGTGIEGVTYMDCGDARGWAQTLLVCSLGGDPKYADFICSALRDSE